MRPLILVTLAGLLLARPATAIGGEQRPIPQDSQRQRQRFRDMLGWNRRTLAAAYDRVGKKDPRWDKPARAALEAAARHFSHAVDPFTKQEEVYTAAKQALDAGCDDPLILYLYARSSYLPNYPGPDELERRYLAAAVALEPSAYPPFRRALALYKAGQQKAARKDLSPADRAGAARLLDAALALLPKSVAEDERNADMENDWFQLPREVIKGHRQLTGDYRAAFDRVNAELAKTAALKMVRLLVKGDFLIQYAWEARGSGTADTVTEEGSKQFTERLTEARKVLAQAWAAEPGNQRAATLMITVELGLGRDRDEMEKWFERAIKADGTNKGACEAKLQWLAPKWHGSVGEVLAFGRACRDTKNWRAGITLLLAQAHLEASRGLAAEEQAKYFRSAEVWNDVQTVYDEYLQHNALDDAQHCLYAAYCYLGGKYEEAERHFRAARGLVWNKDFPQAWMKQVRGLVAQAAQGRPSTAPAERRPGSASPK